MKLLAIDDKPDNLVALTAMLRTYLPGCEVATAPSGVEGVEKARAFDPDTILLDIQMPGMDGFEACRILKGDPATRHIPIIFLTAQNADPASRIHGLETGGDAFLAKPVEPGELMAQVRAMVRIKQAEDVLRGEKYALERLVAERTATLRDRDEWQRIILQAAMDGFWLADMDGRILDVNETYCKMSGYSMQELRAMRIPGLEAMETAEDTFAHSDKVMTQGADRFESRHRRKDGTLFDVEVSVQYRPLEGGRLVAFLRDITERKRAERALEAGERRFRSVLETVSLIGVMLDLDGNITLCNDYLLLLTGWAREEVLNKNWFDLFVPPEIRGEIRQEVFLKIIGTGTVPAHHQNEIIARAGERRLVEWSNTVIRNPQGEVMGVASIGQDITDRKRAEEALRESEEKYRELVENVSDVIYEVDHQGNFAYVSPAIRNILGYEPEEVLGRPFARFVHPEDRGLLASRFVELAGGIEKPFEYRVLSKTGETHWIRTLTKPVLKQGVFSGAHGTLSDITERKRAESALRLSEEKFRKAFEMGPDAININRLDDGLYVSINQGFTQIMGYSEAEAIGRTSRELDIWDRPEDRKKLLEHLRRNGAMANLEAAFRAKNGEIRHGLMSASIIEIDGIPHILSITRDISMRKRLRQELDAAKKLETIGMITGGVAHEVRNPLNSIQIMAAVLDKKQRDDPDIRQCVAHIQEQVQRLTLLMKDLLLLGRPADAAHFAPCDLWHLVNSAARLAADGAGSDGRVQVRLGGLVPPVVGDADKLTQVLINLLQNALTLSPEGTPVEVGLCTEDGMAQIRVKDLGPGIEADFLPRLFQPFQSKRKGGTGLGLAIVHKIVTDHGGAVEAANNGPGPGATFTVRLPLGE